MQPWLIINPCEYPSLSSGHCLPLPSPPLHLPPCPPQSVLRIAKSRTRIFKCPYCPMEAKADNLRPLTFPDMD